MSTALATFRAFTTPVVMEDGLLGLLARHLAMDLLPAAEIRELMGLDERQLDTLYGDVSFAILLRRERQRLLTLDGRREIADWKAVLSEGQYLDRLMTLACADATAPANLLEGYKLVKRPVEKAVAGGAGSSSGPMFVVNINVPNAPAMTVSAPYIDGDADNE